MGPERFKITDALTWWEIQADDDHRGKELSNA
jgi:hypothetical protein